MPRSLLRNEQRLGYRLSVQGAQSLDGGLVPEGHGCRGPVRDAPKLSQNVGEGLFHRSAVEW